VLCPDGTELHRQGVECRFPDCTLSYDSSHLAFIGGILAGIVGLIVIIAITMYVKNKFYPVSRLVLFELTVIASSSFRVHRSKQSGTVGPNILKIKRTN
jgi:hypothetical protein